MKKIITRATIRIDGKQNHVQKFVDDLLCGYFTTSESVESVKKYLNSQGVDHVEIERT